MFTDAVTTGDDPPATPATGWDDFAVLTPVPPDESFWRKHNGNLEMPTSLVLSLFIMSAAFAAFAFLMLYAIGGPPEQPMPPITMVDGGLSDAGLGNVDAGEGGSAPIKADPTTPREEIKIPDTPPADLPAVTVSPDQSPIGEIAPMASQPQDSNFGALDDKVNRILTVGLGGNKSGLGVTGSGPTGGEAGVGSDMTKARSLRWVMKFETSGGRDYLEQLHALGAIILVPVPNKAGQFYVFKDLLNPKPGALATDDEIRQYFTQITFGDSDRDTLAKLAPALGLDFTPGQFSAVFPKGVEKQLADKERAYRGLRPEDVGTTKFSVNRRGGSYQFQVVEQTRR